MAELPEEVQATVEKLTHRARHADDDATARAHRTRRDEILADNGFVARVREEPETVGGPGRMRADRPTARGTREVLVLYPDEWVEDGTVQIEAIEDLDRAIEIPLSGPGDPDDWDAIAEHNGEIAATVRRDHGDVHGDNARAFADFMDNHYAKRIEHATPREIEEFLEEYFPRNAWPSDDQRAVVEESIARTRSVATRGSDGPD